MNKWIDHTTQSPMRETGANGGAPAGSWWRRLEDRIWAVPDQSAHKLKLFVMRWLQILHRSVLGFYDHNGFANVSSLTYTTFLTIVPMLAILLVSLKGFGVDDMAREALKRHPLVAQLNLSSANTEPLGTADATGQAVITPAPAVHEPLMTGADVIDRVFDFVDNTRLANLGIIGGLGILLIVGSLLFKIEIVMNEVWAIHRTRPLGRMLADYMSMLMVMILMVTGLSVTASGQLFTGVWAENLGLNTAQTFFLRHIPYLIIWPAFFGMYYYIPNTRVKWRSAFAGALVGGTLYQLVQFMFIHSAQALMKGYDKVYGAFGVVLILIFWVYVSWLIVLLGAEICSAYQNLRDLRRRRRLWKGTPVEHETLALRLVVLLALPLLDPQHNKRMDEGDLADALTAPPGPIGELLELLRSHGLLVQSSDEGGFMLACSPEKLTVLDVLRLVRQGTLIPAAAPANQKLGQMGQHLARPLARQSIKELAAQPLQQIQTITF